MAAASSSPWERKTTSSSTAAATSRSTVQPSGSGGHAPVAPPPPTVRISSTSSIPPTSPAAQPSSSSASPALLFAGVLLGVAANVLVAKRYGKRVMSWAVPKENKHNQFVDRNMYAEFWDPGLKQARWEAYFTAAAEEEKRQAERLYQWMMHEREREELKAKLHRFYHERVDQHTWDGAGGFKAEDFFGGQKQRQGWRRRRKQGSGTVPPPPTPSELTRKLLHSKQVLGLAHIQDERQLSETQVKDAFRKQALQWHPDRVAPEERDKSSAKFKEINEAYDFLMKRVSVNQWDEEEEDW